MNQSASILMKELNFTSCFTINGYSTTNFTNYERCSVGGWVGGGAGGCDVEHSRHLSMFHHLDLELSCAPSDVFASRHSAVHNEVFPLLVMPSAERKWKSDCQVHNCCPRGHHTNLHPVSKAIRPSVILTLLYLQTWFNTNCND